MRPRLTLPPRTVSPQTCPPASSLPPISSPVRPDFSHSDFSHSGFSRSDFSHSGPSNSFFSRSHIIHSLFWGSFFLASFFALTACSPPEPPPPAGVTCNGSAENCARRFDQVTFVATHNAFSYAEGGPVGYLYPNQDFPIRDQLKLGVRGLGIRPCPYYGSDPSESARVYVTHNFSLMGKLGSEPLADVLAAVRTFLEQNPSEVVTLFAESAVTPRQIAEVFTEVGLDPYLYVHDATRGFPTLSQMVQDGRRLVVFNDSRDPARPPWQHYLWDLIVDTDYNITDVSQFTCDAYRGQIQNPLYFINQFVYLPLSSDIVVPDKARAQQANDPQRIYTRAVDCWRQTGRIPNFIYVDWVGQGDPIGAMTRLNALARNPTP